MDNLRIIIAKLDTISLDIKELKTDVADLKTDVTGLKTDVANLNNRVDRIDKRQDAIFEQTASLLEFRKFTEEMLTDIRNDQMSVSQILGEHEIYIRSLRRRSV
ncbi:MAG: hypothetical protein ACYDEJ_07140 [Desulfitobacteriaceae bacterium]